VLKALVGPIDARDPARYRITQLAFDGLAEAGLDVRGYTQNQRLHWREDVRDEGPYADCVDASSMTELLATLEAEGWVPDVVLDVYVGEGALFPDVISCPIPTAALVSDWDANGHLLETVLPFYDHVILEPSGLEYAQAIGLARTSTSLIWRPSELVQGYRGRAAEDPRDYDLSFMGMHYPRRGLLVQDLALRLSDKRLYMASYVAPGEYWRALAQSRIALNVSRRNEFTVRCFEAPLSGALLLTNRSMRADLDRFYREDEHYVSYGDVAEAAERSRWLLEHPDELCRIASAGQARARELIEGRYRRRIQVWLEHLMEQVGLPELQAARDRRLDRLKTGQRARLEAEAYLSGAYVALPGVQRLAMRGYEQLIAAFGEDDPEEHARWLNNHAACRWRYHQLCPQGLRLSAKPDRLRRSRTYRSVARALELAARDPGVSPIARLNLGLLARGGRDPDQAVSHLRQAAAELRAREEVEGVVAAGVLFVAEELNFRGGPQLWSYPLEELQIARGPDMLVEYRHYLAAYALWLAGGLMFARGAPSVGTRLLEEAAEALPIKFYRRCCGPERSLSSFPVWRQLGDARLERRDHAGALEAYRQDLALDPTDRQAWTAYMKGLARAWKPKEMRAFCEERARILAAYPGEAAARHRFERIAAQLAPG
jgi:hypothetical protein